MNKNLKIATLFALLIAVWLASGAFDEPEAPVPDVQAALGAKADPKLATVVATEMRAEPRALTRVLRGKTASKRTAKVSAEVAGQVVARPVERGDLVEAGDLLCEIAVNERAAVLKEAKAAVQQAEMEYEGATKLQGKNLLAETQAAKLAAQLEAARANLIKRELDLKRTRIVAPFSGVVDTLPMVLGDYARVGDVCATLIDLDPILIVVDVSERDVSDLHRDDVVTARTSTGELLEGKVTFIGSQSSELTRTYPVEITVSNPDYRVRSGLTTVVNLAGETVSAHRVSPSLFTLDDAGLLGMRAVNENDQVVFYPVKLIEDSPSGAWVTGLPKVVRLITVGHEFVADGQTVTVERAGPGMRGEVRQ